MPISSDSIRSTWPVMVALMLTAAGFALQAGCITKECTEIGCLSGPTVEFSEVDWRDGAWTVELRGEQGTVGTCEVELPATERMVHQCDGPYRLSIGEDGTRIAQVNPSYASDERDQIPTSLTVRLNRDDELVAEKDFDVDYEKSRPNGPGCPPVCEQASVEVTANMSASGGR